VESCTAIGEKENGEIELIRWHDVVREHAAATPAGTAALQAA
jgi:hypothetical protein